MRTDPATALSILGVAQMIADNNNLSHDLEDFTDAAEALHRAGLMPAAELAKVNQVLHEHGFDYPQGARGVADAVRLQTARWEAAEARIKAALDELDRCVADGGRDVLAIRDRVRAKLLTD